MPVRPLVFLFAALLLAACGEKADGPPIDWPAPSPALWEVSGPDGARGWLFGTIHRLPEHAEWSTPALERAFAARDVLVLEISEYDRPQATQNLLQRMGRSEGLPPPAARVAAPLRDDLQTTLERLDLSPAEARRYETWSLALLLSAALDSSDAGLGVDRALFERAEGKPVVALETVAGQFALFDNLAEADQVALLEDVLEDAPSARAKARSRALSWFLGDLDAIATELDGGIGSDPQLRSALIDRRNIAWADRVQAILTQRRRPFVAVGTAHLIGAGGLPALLERRGYTVRRIQ